MFKSLEDISLTELKKNHARLYYFGLGFIQLKIDNIWRLHFYSDKLPPITKEEPHNHRYKFTSHILHGELENTLYFLEDGNTHVIVNESCNEHKDAPALDTPCTIAMEVSTTYPAGSSYVMEHDQFHSVATSGNCITLLERGGYEKEYAQIVFPKGAEKVCPFSKKVPDEELWKIMEEMLNGANAQ